MIKVIGRVLAILAVLLMLQSAVIGFDWNTGDTAGDSLRLLQAIKTMLAAIGLLQLVQVVKLLV